MPKKPWSINILAFLFISEPLVKLLFYSWYWNRDIHFLLTTTPMKSPYMVFMFFFACPVAGIAIWAVKRWSLPVFLMIEALILFGHFSSWHSAPEYFSTFLFVAMTLLNAVVVSYFLIPAVRIAYLDPRVRWWAQKPRYEVSWPCTISQGKLSEKGLILNLSEGGVRLNLVKKVSFESGKSVNIEFKFEGFSFSLPSEIRYQMPADGAVQYGVQFEEASGKKRLPIRQCIRVLERRKFPRRPGRESRIKSLAQWLYVLFTTGKGLIPPCMQPRDPKSSLTLK